MSHETDLRVRRTYACLLNAILKLLEEKPFEDITVNELCERAMVGRGTFYDHFSDKYEFFSFALGEMFGYYLEKAGAEIDDSDPCSYYTAFFGAYIQFIKSNSAYFAPLSSSSSTTVLLFTTSDSLCRKLEDRFRKDIDEGRSLCISPTAAARFLTGAMAQSARYLIEHRDDGAREDLEADMKTLITKLFA